MADRSFGVKEINIIGSSTGVGTPTMESPTNLNLNANRVAISTDVHVGRNINIVGIATVKQLSDYKALVGAASSTTETFTVTVASKTSNHRYFGTGSGSGYLIDGRESPFITLLPGKTYRFDQADGSNNTHQLRFYLEADRTTEYTTNVTFNGTAGNAGAYTQITVTDTTPIVLHYQCVNHGYMGNSVQTNSNFINTPHTLFAKQLSVSGVVTASSFSGSGIGLTGIPAGQLTGALPALDGSALTGVVGSGSGIVIKDSGTTVGTAGTIDFGDNLTVSPISAGIVTVTASSGSGSSQFVTTAAGIHTLSNVGIGTTNPGEKLQVDGNIRVGISTTSNYITFRGTHYDGPANTGGELTYQHTYIGERIYDYSGNGERSELLVFKGNDIADISGPDRIRLFAGEHRFDVLGFSTTGTFEQVGVSTAAINKLTITSTGVGIGTTNPTSALTVKGNTFLETLVASSVVSTAVVSTGIITSQNGRFSLGGNGAYFQQDRLSLTGNELLGDFLHMNPNFWFVSSYTGIGANLGIGDWIFYQRGSFGSVSEVARISGLTGNASFTGSLSASSASFSGSLSASGNLNVSGVSTFAGITTVTGTTLFAKQLNVSGVVTASSFVGDGSQLTGITASGSNVIIRDSGTLVGTAGTIDFGDNLTVSAVSAGVVTVTGGTINNGTLTLAVSGTGLSGSQTFTANQSSNATFTVTSNATSSNTASTLVARDGSGDFTAGTINATSFRTNTTVGNGSDVGFAIKYYITASGSSAYRFAGPGVLNSTNNPTLYLHRGFTYIFENSTGSSHPFAIRTSSGGSAYTSSFLSGSQSGTQIFTVPFDAPNTLVYQCTIHAAMVGTLNIVT